MRHSPDIVMVSLSRWDDAYSSTAFSLAKEFAKKHRVFYIDHPFSLKDVITNRIGIKPRLPALLFGNNIYYNPDKLSDNLTIVTPKVTLPINWMNEGWLYNVFYTLNEKIVSNILNKIIKDFAVKEYIFFNSYDPLYFQNIPSDLQPVLKIYQTVDDIAQDAYTAKHGARLERKMFANSDLTLATSKRLATLASKYSPKVFLLPNAADFTLFKKAMNGKLICPKELINVNRKVICYTGNIGTRIDYELLSKVAHVHTDKILLLVGPLNTKTYSEYGLDKISNIIFTGSKDISSLPAYLQYSDCLIIPFEYSALTASIYPLKVNEYLASGKPVVTTAFSEDIQSFSDVAYVASTHDDFIGKIDLAIRENDLFKEQARTEKAAQNTWQARVSLFWTIVDPFLDH